MPRLPVLRWFDSRPPLLTVDHPKPDQQFAGWIDVRGWAVVPSGAPLVVRISVDDQDIRVVKPDTPRPDVVAAYPGMAGTDRCGFETRLTREELPDRDRLTLTFELLVDGRAGRAQERTVRSVPVQRHASAMPLGGTGKVDHYVTGAPDPPLPRGHLCGGVELSPAPAVRRRARRTAARLRDPRVAWAITALGGVEGRQVLEVGPLEGGHTWMLEQAGAARVIAVEANARALLRCLIVKELVGLPRTTFLLGDALAYLDASPPPFDAALAAGVLSHDAARGLPACAHRGGAADLRLDVLLRSAPSAQRLGRHRHRGPPVGRRRVPAYAASGGLRDRRGRRRLLRRHIGSCLLDDA